jgi:membrane-associated phospholipid phosphatase
MLAAVPASSATRALAVLLCVTLALPAGAQDSPASSSPAPSSVAPSPAPSPSPGPPAGPVAEGEPEARPRGWNDQRRTMRSYPNNLAYNTMGVLTRGNYGPIALMFAATPAAMTLDDECIDYFAEHDYERFADFGETLGGTLVVTGLTVGFFSAGRIAKGGRFRAATYDVSQATIVNFIYTYTLKYTVSRERPDGSDQLSFPSGHTSNAFAGATVIARHYGWKLGVPAYATATFIGVSRMAANRHHFSDVVGGALLGYGIGRAVVRRNSRPPTPPGGPTPPTPDPPSVALAPWGGPSGDGVGLSVSIVF